MPVDFSTDDQAEAYGKFAEEPTRPELERFFFLDDVDRDLIALRRTKHHQLGFALQMCTVRYVGLFLEDPLVVPWPAVEHLAAQLGIEDPSCVKRYTERRQTLYDHAWGDPGRVRVSPVRRSGVGSGVPYVPARPGVDACGGAGRAVQPGGGLAAADPGAAAGFRAYDLLRMFG
jgi:hypothetical protein